MTTLEPFLISDGVSDNAYPGIPDHWTDLAKAQAEFDLENCLKALEGESLERIQKRIERPSSNADVEDFWEPAARLSAAYIAAASIGSTIKGHTANRWTESEMMRRLGPVAKVEENCHQPDTLLVSRILKDYSGRVHEAVTHYEEEDLSSSGLEDYPDDDLCTRITELHQAGIQKVVVKQAARKTGLVVIETSPSREKVVSRLLSEDALGWSLIRMAGTVGAFSLQEWIPMTYEYRLFVVDGDVITGAGNIEEYTPYNLYDDFGNEGYLASDLREMGFDSRIRKYRGNQIAASHDSAPESKPDLVERYLLRGQELAEEHPGTYTLDLALNEATDEIVVVELNTLPNSGFYASDVWLLYITLANAKDRGYQHYSFVQNYSDTFN